MAVFDPYASCPCGSGKKFRWCCQPIHQEFTKAFQLDEEGQHDAAVKAIEEVVARHPDNPEVHGRKAQLLFQLGKVEEAEGALQKAFDLNPKYAFGHYLKGRFRHIEGEVAGALILFRKAAEYYSPEAATILSDIYAMIAECEMKLQRPVAARAALDIALRNNTQNDSLRQFLDQVFGEQGRLPLAARKQYLFETLPATASSERAEAWKQAVGAAGSTRLTDAATAFEQLTQSGPGEAPAWYNLALSRAWLGQNAGAVEALDKYVSLETDEAKAIAAWTLAEVLRLGHGMEENADFVETGFTFTLKNPQAFVDWLSSLEGERRLLAPQINQEENILTALILEKLPPALTPELAAQQAPRLAGSLTLMGPVGLLRSGFREGLLKLVDEVKQKLGSVIGESHENKGPIGFNELFAEAMVFPVGLSDQAAAGEKLRAELGKFFEEIWLHRPLKSLGGAPPIDAIGHPVLKKKVLGLVELFGETAAACGIPCDFDRVKRKLGAGSPSATSPASGPVDVTALGAAELAALSIESLAADQLEQAFQSALKLDARDLAGKFAEALVALPARKEKPDRYPWFNHLIVSAQNNRELDKALEYVDAAAKDDCENNEGRRRNDYELRRGQLHAKRGEIDQAQDVFDRLIARVPSDTKILGTATEAMLSAKQGSRAKAFAEKGLALAKQQNNRDSEGYFQELLGAAQKSG